MKKFLVIEGCNFTDFPSGGQLTFVKQLIKSFGNEVALVGISTDDTPIGVWVKKEINGISYDYFAYQKRVITNVRPLMPARLSGYYGLLKYRDEILKNDCRSVFLQSHELLSVVLKWRLNSVCYCFPGIENPLSISRYAWAKSLAPLFDKWFLPKVAQADIVLAAADCNAIAELRQRSGLVLATKCIFQFPTRVDTNLYAQKNINVRPKTNGNVVVTTGRIHWAKGWLLILLAFCEFLKIDKSATLIYVGDGEDRKKLEFEISRLRLNESVTITGRVSQEEVANYLRKSDLFVLGSQKEGWSTSLVEALSVGIPIVTTNVSSASTIVQNGVNGFVLEGSSTIEFAKYMYMAVQLDSVKLLEHSKMESEKYSVNNLMKDLNEVWPTSPTRFS